MYGWIGAIGAACASSVCKTAPNAVWHLHKFNASPLHHIFPHLIFDLLRMKKMEANKHWRFCGKQGAQTYALTQPAPSQPLYSRIIKWIALFVENCMTHWRRHQAPGTLLTTTSNTMASNLHTPKLAIESDSRFGGHGNEYFFFCTLCFAFSRHETRISQCADDSAASSAQMHS